MKFEAEAQIRTTAGKGVARELRRNGKIPGVLYGKGKSTGLSLDPATIRKILLAQAGSTGLISVKINDAGKNEERLAVIQDFQRDPITGHLLHVDLFEVSMDKPVRVKVQVQVVGSVPIGVKRDKGVLHVNLRELHVECLPGQIPEHIDIDATELEINQGVHVREVQVGEGLKVLDDPSLMVVNISAPISEAKLSALLTTGEAAEVPAAEGAAPETPAGEKAGGAAPAPPAGKAPEGKT